MPTPDPGSPAAIAARCRKAQRQLDESAPGSPENDRLAARVRDLAEEYRAAIGKTADENRRAKGKQRVRGRT